ncbi:hypothetical protein TGAM01_v201013 [Trichoderma gamsii]|uniref:Uncharacterized protein n=1 Tax=Trichoderma gamsii TaxID=398673 RepID=A0A2P5A213_9HYPO|nr:hypothetical protein TGAM01_v201013 [Trichoderma gamsii]PON30573.1 hypothetical protein TGAM01_v201013 [Trichoderma gamsii]
MSWLYSGLMCCAVLCYAVMCLDLNIHSLAWSNIAMMLPLVLVQIPAIISSEALYFAAEPRVHVFPWSAEQPLRFCLSPSSLRLIS